MRGYRRACWHPVRARQRLDMAQEPEERRRHPRFCIATTAAVYADHACMGIFAIDSLSSGGASFLGRLDIAVGRDLAVHIGVPGAYPLGLKARLVRVAADSTKPMFAVEFIGMLSPAVAALVEELATGLSPPPIPPSVLVIDDDVRIHEALWFQLWRLDRGCVCVRTPLEAVLALQEQQSPIKAILVDLVLPLADGAEILKFAAHHYAKIRRILMSGVANVDHLQEAVKLSHADAILMKPWKPKELVVALGLL
jgi:CheY-like chemotaxis protein